MVEIAEDWEESESGFGPLIVVVAPPWEGSIFSSGYDVEVSMMCEEERKCEKGRENLRETLRENCFDENREREVMIVFCTICTLYTLSKCTRGTVDNHSSNCSDNRISNKLTNLTEGLEVIPAQLQLSMSMSLPLLRWKKNPVLAAITLSANQAVIQLGYFLHMQTYVFKRPVIFPRRLIFCVAIVSLFFIVIALFKDIPDMEGDKKFGVQSLSVHWGPKRVFWICVSLLEMAYGVAILVGATSPFLWSKISTGLGHAIMASILWYHAKSIDLKSTDTLQSFYVFIWKLLWAEYFLIPLFR